MSDAVIQVKNLSKRYLIGHQRGRHDGLRHAIEAVMRNPVQWLRDRKQAVSQEREEFWALKDVCFEIKQGDVVGVIGRNGAGKSTLLKILSRITEPTAGEIEITGRVASLLEVGTGFHPELTGRENIFLNGAILGMSRAEIKSKFDEIVAFAEIEKFLDTPVKRYSSGMYVRLAFAVAAHLEPEILIVDEVLAVGDAAFQKKCLGKMKDVSRGGRTVVFVGHNMAAIRSLCNKGMLLTAGRLVLAGGIQEVVSAYLIEGEQKAKTSFQNKGIKISSVSFFDENGETSSNTLQFGNAYTLSIMLDCVDAVKSAVVISVLNDEGTKVSSINSIEEGNDFWNLSTIKQIKCFIKNIRLMPGHYSLTVDLCDQHNMYLRAERALQFIVEPQCLPHAPWAYNSSHGVFRITDLVEAT